MKVLIIAPHSDDDVLGVGGTIANHVKNHDEVYNCIVTTAYTPEWTQQEVDDRYFEVIKVAEILGIKKVYRLGLPTVKLDTLPHKMINDMLFDVIQEVSPDVLYIPHHSDVNKDHQIIFDSAMVAIRPINKVPTRVLSYEVLSSTEWYPPINRIFNPNVFIDITETLPIKIRAMQEYKHGLKKSPHPRSIRGIEALASLRGMTAGVEYAEAFSLVREIIK